MVIRYLLITVFLLQLGQSLLAQGQVFPGDANADGRVNQYDLLPMAYAFGANGPIRHNGNGEEAEDILALWSDAFPDGTNYIHADANGNGFVDLLDFGLLYNNRGIIHDPGDQGAPQVFVSSDEYNVILNNGENIDPTSISGVLEIPVFVAPLDPENEINGIAFEFSWDPAFVVSASFEYNPAWMAFDGQAVSYLHADDEHIQFSASRLGSDPMVGGGLLGTLSVIIIEDLVDLMPSDPDITIPFVEVGGISSFDGDFVPLQTGGQPLFFNGISAVSSTEPEIQQIQATIFPNPSRAEVNLQSQQGFQRIDLVDMLGRQTNLYRGPELRSYTLDASDLPAGNYFLRLQGTAGFGTYRFIRSAE